MKLDEVREKINSVDSAMKELFDNRMKCSSEVAWVKMSSQDDVFKPEREKDICRRFDKARDYQMFVKKVMQLSRKYQYSIFADNNLYKDKFKHMLTAENRRALEEGGILSLNLKADNTFTKGLPVKDIISIIGDTGLKLLSLSCSEDEVNAELWVPEDDMSKKEAVILTYMLYMETL